MSFFHSQSTDDLADSDANAADAVVDNVADTVADAITDATTTALCDAESVVYVHTITSSGK